MSSWICLRRASVGNVRAPHKPLLLLWLFGSFAATGSTAAGYAEAEEPVSALINGFGPPVASASAGRQRAAMPFVHLEREIWDLRDRSGVEIGPDAPERGSWLAGRGTAGRLRPGVEQLLADPGTLAAAARLLLDLHFTPGLASMICDAVGLDLAVLELAAMWLAAVLGGGRWTTCLARRCSPPGLASPSWSWITPTGITGRSSRAPTFEAA